ncbi:MAG TPA: nucleotidyltransferase [Cyclobacteriaceae bacterium]|nr:nucleotidyltransferase [Cyclobacteriaceae bacterium]HPW63715.1 nucleotidyltransferase [Cyclobacteriaceae bacterium]
MELSDRLKALIENLLATLNKHKVEFIAVGGLAVNHHGYSRASNDIDFWYKPSVENFHRITDALTDLGYDTSDLKTLVFDAEKTILRIPLDYFNVELLPRLHEEMKSLEALRGFNEALKNAEINSIGEAKFNVIGFEDLIFYKAKSGRPKDMLDIIELRNIRGEKD